MNSSRQFGYPGSTRAEDDPSSTPSHPAMRSSWSGRSEGRGIMMGWPQLSSSPSFSSSPLSFVKSGMARAAEELMGAMDRLNLGHSSLRSLRQALLTGDEAKAIEAYQSIDKMGKSLAEEMQPSVLFKVSKRHGESTVVHLAAAAALPDILQLFLERGGDPNIRSSRKETAVHSVCQRTDHRERRLACLKALLSWVGPEIDGFRETASVNAVDASGCTAAHHAAAAGSMDLLRDLVARGANLTIVNADQETASDCAARKGHKSVADWLEAQVIFGEGELTSHGLLDSDQQQSTATAAGAAAAQGTDDEDVFVSMDWEEVERRREEVLNEAIEQHDRDQLVMLLEKLEGAGDDDGYPRLARAGGKELLECLLHGCQWNQSELAKAWADGRDDLLRRCHVDTYQSSDSDWFKAPQGDPREAEQESVKEGEGKEEQGEKNEAGRTPPITVKCPICQEVVDREDMMSLRGQACSHCFCPDCLKEYVSHQIRESNPELLRCPEFSCQSFIPDSVLQSIGLPEELGARYHSSRVRAFIERAYFLNYCPAASCHWIVERRRREGLHDGKTTAAPKDDHAGHGERDRPVKAQCRDGHSFCWLCKQEAHAPCSCEAWKAWTEVVAKETLRAEEDLRKKAARLGGPGVVGAEKEAEFLANALWLSANTKECPKCSLPLEKSSGCNHMTCLSRTCRYEFCWICGEAWELHSTATGGFFRCNRFLESPSLVEADSSKSGGGADSSSMNRAAGVEEALGGGMEVQEEVVDGHEAGMMREGSHAAGGGGSVERQNGLQAQPGSAIQEAKRMAEQSRRMARFIHHYTRYRAHVDSSRIEKIQHEETRTRVQHCLCIWLDITGQLKNHARQEEGEEVGGVVKAAATSPPQQEQQAIKAREEEGAPAAATTAAVPSSSPALDVDFFDGAFEELERARITLRNSYAFAFFELANPPSRDLKDFVPDDSKLMQLLLAKADKNSSSRDGGGDVLAAQRLPSSSRRTSAKKHVFERHQSELEMMVETLSGLIDPPGRRLHASKSEITSHTAAVSRKRVEFEHLMGRGLDALVTDTDISPLRPRRSDRRERRFRDWGGEHRPQGTYFTDGFGERASSTSRRYHHRPRTYQQPGLDGAADTSLYDDILEGMDASGLEGIDLEVAMMDRAIHMSLLQQQQQVTKDQPQQEPVASSLPRPSGDISVGQAEDTIMIPSKEGRVGQQEEEKENSRFICQACTLINSGGRVCALCGTEKGAEVGGREA